MNGGLNIFTLVAESSLPVQFVMLVLLVLLVPFVGDHHPQVTQTKAALEEAEASRSASGRVATSPSCSAR